VVSSGTSARAGRGAVTPAGRTVGGRVVLKVGLSVGLWVGPWVLRGLVLSFGLWMLGPPCARSAAR